MNTQLNNMLRRLIEMRDCPESIMTHYGICGNVAYAGAFDQFLYELIRRWPERSTANYYPVKHPDLDPELAYFIQDKWKKDTYGDNRRSLLNWLIDELGG